MHLTGLQLLSGFIIENQRQAVQAKVPPGRPLALALGLELSLELEVGVFPELELAFDLELALEEALEVALAFDGALEESLELALDLDFDLEALELAPESDFALEEDSDGLKVCSRVRVENHDVVQVSEDTREVFDDEVDDADEPAGSGGGALGHDEPLHEA